MREKTSNRMKGRSPSPSKPKKVQETAEHARLKTALKEIMSRSGFEFDSEVALNFSGNCDDNGKLSDERSIDIAAYGSSKGKSFLFVFECKGGADLKEIHKKISSWEADIEKIRSGKANVISSEGNSIKKSDFDKFDDIRICYVFGNSIDRERYKEIASILEHREFYAWDNGALTYYKKTASTVGKAVKYEILREFEVNLESSGLFCEKAIQIRQGELEMFVFGAKPSVLLKVGYVHRRASRKPHAYQRILNRDRIEKISEFLSSGDALLPNAIIIAFDNDPVLVNQILNTVGDQSNPIRRANSLGDNPGSANP